MLVVLLYSLVEDGERLSGYDDLHMGDQVINDLEGYRFVEHWLL